MKSLETIWLIIGVVMTSLLVWDIKSFPNKNISERLIYIFGMGLAAFMYNMRRTQRLKQEKQQQNQSDNQNNKNNQN